MNKRIINLDFLRAIVIIFALMEHYSYYMNVWFQYYHDNEGYSKHVSSFLEQYMHNMIIPDAGILFMFKYFVVWVSHIYVTLAAFNLAKYSSIELKSKIKDKLIIFLGIASFFIIESSLVSNTFGEAITIHPIFTWMILLSMITIIYSFFDILGIILSFILSIIMVWMSHSLNSGELIQDFVTTYIHKGFQYDARLEFFVISAYIGFFIGYINYHAVNKYMKLYSLSIILLACSIILRFDQFTDFHNSVNYMFNKETVYYSSFGNLMWIGFIMTFIITTMIWLEEKQIIINNSITNYISYNSIFIFAIHKMLFVRFIMPLRVFIYGICHIPLTDTLIECILYSLIVIFMSYLIKKLNIIKIIFKA